MLPVTLACTAFFTTEAMERELAALSPPGLGGFVFDIAPFYREVFGREPSDWEMACDIYEADLIRMRHFYAAHPEAKVEVERAIKDRPSA